MKLIEEANKELLIENQIDEAFQDDIDNGVMDDLITEALNDYKTGDVVE